MKIEEAIKQKKFESDVQKAYLNIIYTAGWLQTKMKDMIRNYGITSQQYNVLRILRGKYPENANPKDIKDVMLDKNPDLTRLCDRMLKLGYIERAVCESNRRKMNIAITEKGLALLEELDPIVLSLFDQISENAKIDFSILSDMLDEIRHEE